MSHKKILRALWPIVGVSEVGEWAIGGVCMNPVVQLPTSVGSRDSRVRLQEGDSCH